MTTTCHYMQTNWIRQMTNTLMKLNPEADETEIENFVLEEYLKNFTDHDCMLYNSYENSAMKSTLGGICDWIQEENPLIVESGVYFYQKSKMRNVNVEIIKDNMLDARTVHKKEMFEAMERGDTFTAAVKDIQQGNDKKAANSGYGAEGQSSSFLFNVHSAMSVTAGGRGQLSTAILCFENLFADNVKFWDMNECFTYLMNILKEKKQWKFDTFSIVKKVPSKKRWIERYKNKFLHITLCDEQQLNDFYDSLDDEEIIRTFYKSNFNDFLYDNKIPNRLYGDIAETDVEFIDPNKVPDELKEPLDYLVKLVIEFVNYKYSSIRYQDKARYERRKVVIVSDTDS